MIKLSLIAIDLAKNVFQVCGMTPHHKVAFNQPLKRNQLAAFIANQPPVEIAMEACYSSHYWGRLFQSMGHTVRLLPAQHVAPFVRGNKSDHNDALAIAEAARRPHLQPVPLKSVEQQDIQCLHRVRERYIAHRIGVSNQARGLLSEYGIVAPTGHQAFRVLLSDVCQPAHTGLSPLLKVTMQQLAEEHQELTRRIDEVTQQLTLLARQEPLCDLLMSIPGIGVINASALYSAIGNGSQFRNGREFAVWLGLTPRQSSSGDKLTRGGITKRGNKYLRKQLIHGARAMLYRARKKTDRLSQWGSQLLLLAEE